VSGLSGYRSLVYAATLATGFSGLIYQVVWQKYLTFVLGSDARSVALVVATFLAGLAAGYRYWGRTTEREFDRRAVLRRYGWLELGIAAYAALFLPWLEVVRALAQRAPEGLASDAIVAVLTLLPPTFLMGATIPLLVRCLPERSDEVHLCHARIYGINTLGACLGAFGASLVLIPRLGLPATLGLGLAINLAVGLLFVFNPLRGRIAEHEPIAEIPNRLGPPLIYLYTLVTGTVALSLEVLCVRVLNLSIGAGPHNFALVVGVFVLGLAVGSLCVGRRLLGLGVLFAALGAAVAWLALLYFSVPYWPYWLSNLRAGLPLAPESYDAIQLQVVLFLTAALLPFLICLGFMLPLAYALLPKNTADYGKKCGWLYFYNTLGTATGAVVLSYVALGWFDLDQVFKFDVLLLTALLVLVAARQGRRGLAAVALVAAVAFAAAPRWNRSAHHVGLFNYLGPFSFNFQGLLSIPVLVPDIRFFRDGPDATITVAWRPGPDPGSPLAARIPPGAAPLPGTALLNNGRSEGDSVGDYSTMALAAALPYLHAPDRRELDVAVIGLGSGITAGLLGRAEDVSRVTVVEISPTLIEAARWFSEANHDLLGNPRVRVVPMDGFKYFARLDRPVDVIVSEPSVPWVAGVENLFTPEYYRLARAALSDDGVFMQWFPLYTSQPELFRAVLRNILEVFSELRLFRISAAEMGLLASGPPLSAAAAPRRLAEPVLGEACARMHLVDADQLELIREFDAPEIRYLSRAGAAPRHTLAHPSLSYASDRIRFVPREFSWDDFLDPRLVRITRHSPARERAFSRLVARFPHGLACTSQYSGAELFCDRLNGLLEAWSIWHGGDPAAPRVGAYDTLRQDGVLGPDPARLVAIVAAAVAGPDDLSATAPPVLVVLAKDGLFEAADAALALLAASGRLEAATIARWRADLEAARRDRDAFVAAHARERG